jgi:hypothetical protein
VGEGAKLKTSATPIAEIESRKDDIFRKVGRNVVNLQRLEQRFKTLLSLYLDTPLSKLSETLETRREAFARLPMGALTHELIDRLVPESSPQGEFEGLVTQVWFSISIGIEGDEKMRRELRANLKRLVDERNALVHHMFCGFDPRSEEACSGIEQMLDAQSAHVEQVFNWVEPLIDTHRMLMQGVETWVRDPNTFDK